MAIDIKNNKEEVPLEHYLDEFKKIDPEQRAKELEIPYVDQKFTVTMYGVTYEIKWPEGTVDSEDKTSIGVTKISAQILLLRYIMNGKVLPTSGAYKTFRELPWGEVYIKPFTGRCITRMAYKYNFGKEKFAKAAVALGGQPLNSADHAFFFDFIGDYHLKIYLWGADEEFPPNSQIEFSDNFALGFSPEDNVVIAELLITAISDKMRNV